MIQKTNEHLVSVWVWTNSLLPIATLPNAALLIAVVSALCIAVGCVALHLDEGLEKLECIIFLVRQGPISASRTRSI